MKKHSHNHYTEINNYEFLENEKFIKLTKIDSTKSSVLLHNEKTHTLKFIFFNDEEISPKSITLQLNKNQAPYADIIKLKDKLVIITYHQTQNLLFQSKYKPILSLYPNDPYRAEYDKLAEYDYTHKIHTYNKNILFIYNEEEIPGRINDSYLALFDQADIKLQIFSLRSNRLMLVNYCDEFKLDSVMDIFSFNDKIKIYGKINAGSLYKVNYSFIRLGGNLMGRFLYDDNETELLEDYFSIKFKEYDQDLVRKIINSLRNNYGISSDKFRNISYINEDQFILKNKENSFLVYTIDRYRNNFSVEEMESDQNYLDCVDINNKLAMVKENGIYIFGIINENRNGRSIEDVD